MIIWGGKSKKEVCSNPFCIYLGFYLRYLFLTKLDPNVLERNSTSKSGGSTKKPKQSIYLEQMKNMLFNKLHSDICFEVEGQELFCHKIILTARCKYFQNMFSSFS